MKGIRIGGVPATAGPITVSGSHRSGTSLTARLLIAGGLFYGSDVDTNTESRSFVRASDWLLRLHGVTWAGVPNHPLSPPEQESAAQAIDGTLRRSLNGLPGARYVGCGYLSDLARLRTGHWGWKDPRLVHTVLYWRRLLPQMRVIVVERDGRDVAESLVRRHVRRMDLESQAHPRRLAGYLRQKRGTIGGPAATREHRSALRLWAAYIDAGRQLASGDPRVLTIAYEDLVTNPEAILTAIRDWLASFLDFGLDVAAALDAVEVSSRSSQGSRAWIGRSEEILLAERGYA